MSCSPGSFNYRIVCHNERTSEGVKPKPWYGLHEVLNDNDGKPTWCRHLSICPVGKSADEIQKFMALLMQAFDRPILDAAVFPKMPALTQSERQWPAESENNDEDVTQTQ